MAEITIADRCGRPPFAHAWFFPAASLYGATAVLMWVWGLAGPGGGVPPGLSSPAGHAHEMLFGYALAVVAGFLLGRRPLPVTVALLAAWSLARLAFLLRPASGTAAAAAAVFGIAVAFCVVPPFVRSARKWRNRSMVVIVTGLAGASALAARWAGGPAPPGAAPVLVAAVILLGSLMFFMGGRIIAPAVAGYIIRSGGRLDARVQPALEGTGLVCLAIALVAAPLPALAPLAGAALLTAALAAAVRMGRWRLWRCRKRPDLLILGLGYGWLAAGLALAGISIAAGVPALPRSLHALTIGALGTLTVAVMGRTRLARVGNPGASRAVQLAALLMSGAALARIVPATPGPAALWMSAGLWSGAELILTAVLIAAPSARP